MTVLERIFRDFKFELPSTAIKEFQVDKETVDDPSTTLQKAIHDNAHLLRDVYKEELQQFAKDFESAHGFKLRFEKRAIDRIVELVAEEDKTVRTICADRFKDFEHGLTIICRNSDKKSFVITKSVVDNPDKEISKWVVRSFRDKESEEG